MGAAIQGGILAGDVKDVLLLDVTLSSTSKPWAACSPLIDRNTTIRPAEPDLTTAADNQPSVSIHVLQGERVVHGRRQYDAGPFRPDRHSSAPRGVPQISGLQHRRQPTTS